MRDTSSVRRDMLFSEEMDNAKKNSDILSKSYEVIASKSNEKTSSRFMAAFLEKPVGVCGLTASEGRCPGDSINTKGAEKTKTKQIGAARIA
jgi:hypothetical protein